MAVQPSFDVYQLEYLLVRARNRLHFLVAEKDDPEARKLFVAGHPRTGTGTLHRIFQQNDLDSDHTAGTWRTAQHDCFSDRGNYQPIDRFADYYRNAIFLLNTRPAWNYLKSRMNQTFKKRANRGLLRPRFTARNVANEILRRNNHFLEFVRLFNERENFLVANIERPEVFDFICAQLGLERESDVWTHRAKLRLDDDTVARIDAGFRLLGIEEERSNPFIIKPLLDPSERILVDDFVARHQARIRL